MCVYTYLYLEYITRMLRDVLQVIFRRTTGRTDRGRADDDRTDDGTDRGRTTTTTDGRGRTDRGRTTTTGRTTGRTDRQRRTTTTTGHDGTRRDTTGRTEKISNISQKVYQWFTPRNRHAQTFPD